MATDLQNIKRAFHLLTIGEIMKNLMVILVTILASPMIFAQTTSSGSMGYTNSGAAGTAGSVPSTTSNPGVGTTGSGTINDTMNTTNMPNSKSPAPLRGTRRSTNQNRTPTTNTNPNEPSAPATGTSSY